MSSSEVEKVWILEIQKFFEQEEEEEDDHMDKRTVSIFEVPKTLKAIKPEAYAPQLMAIGPYHHWREDLCEMERYKLIVAKKVQALFQSLTFQDLVDKLAKAEQKIRACYHRYLMVSGETLAWMMAIDGLFLLQFLRVFINRSESVLVQSARMSFLVDSKGKKLGYDYVLKDIMMLENQIPLLVMKKILKIQCSEVELVESMLPQMVLGVCKEIAPLELKEECVIPIMMDCPHLLGVLYHLMVPMCEESQLDEEVKNIPESEKNGANQGFWFGKIDDSTKIYRDLWQKISGLGFFKKIKNGPFKLIGVFQPIISKSASYLGISISKVGKSREGSSNGDEEKKAPRVEEIMIPSVTGLMGIGVQFHPTSGDISSVKFDPEFGIFYLPVVKLNVNSEVILRNLVAYEASAVSGPLVLARYTELMNGIVDTAKDAKILADIGIIKSELSYGEVADIWNGMSKSIRLSHVDFIDQTIKDVNKYFDNTRKVKLYRVMKSYVYGSWRGDNVNLVAF
ncbi:hypothetical protein Cgig2_011947 [Carnegiea gigantea]|uniref:Uncharacterized protein n=1 Tax=Carnegiea gigantea TaxID=171969 RepID=A0A9Q1GN10_9CARY|nr:hypothetical protein Cgig2_011947 [Carnegiea gigantea]